MSEWKQALDAAGERPVCALFANSADIPCRLALPAFARLPEEEEGAFSGVDFVLVNVDKGKDDGLAEQVFDEAFVAKNAVPTFVFVLGCVELREWRLHGTDHAEVVKRLKRIVASDRLDDGPDADLDVEGM